MRDIDISAGASRRPRWHDFTIEIHLHSNDFCSYQLFLRPQDADVRLREVVHRGILNPYRILPQTECCLSLTGEWTWHTSRWQESPDHLAVSLCGQVCTAGGILPPGQLELAFQVALLAGAQGWCTLQITIGACGTVLTLTQSHAEEALTAERDRYRPGTGERRTP